MKFNIKSLGLLLALTLSSNASDINSKVVSSKTVPTTVLSGSKSIPTTTTSGSKTIPTTTTSDSKTTTNITKNSPAMVTTTLYFTQGYMGYPSFTKTAVEVPADVKTALIECRNPKILPSTNAVSVNNGSSTMICDTKTNCYGSYKTFSLKNASVYTTYIPGRCDILTHKGNEPIPTGSFTTTNLCTPTVYTEYVNNYKYSIDYKTEIDEKFYTTYLTIETRIPTIFTQTSTVCNTQKINTRTTTRTTTTTTTPTTTTTSTTNKIIPTTNTDKNLPSKSISPLIYYATATPSYERYFGTAVMSVPSGVKSMQMECTFTKAYPVTTPHITSKGISATSSVKALSSSSSSRLYKKDNIVKKTLYADSCGNLYDLYKSTKTVGEKNLSGAYGVCHIYTHKGDEIKPDFTRNLCSPTTIYDSHITSSLVGIYTNTLVNGPESTVVAKSRIIAKVFTTSTYYECNLKCSTTSTTKAPPSVTTTTDTTTTTTTTTKIPPPITTTTDTTTTTTTTTKIPPPVTTTTDTTTTTISSVSTKCLPVYVTVTEKDEVTVTKKETVTVTVNSVSTLVEDDRQCAEKWAQCGGIGFKGPTCCKSGLFCHELNQYYSQCM